jgi:hypothetical protein
MRNERDETMSTINREQLARDAFWGRHPLLMQHLERAAGSTGFTLRECLDQVAALSDEAIADFIAQGVIADPALEAPGLETPADRGPIDRAQLAQAMNAGRVPLLMLILEHRSGAWVGDRWQPALGFTPQEAQAQLAALSEAQLAEFVARGIIPDPALLAPAAPTLPTSEAPELFPGLAASMRAAGAAIKPWQRQVQPGDAVVLADPDSDLIIFGRVEADPGCPPDYVCGRWCSAAYPPGEMGDNHRSMLLMRLQGDEFERMEATTWPETLDDLLHVLWPVSSDGREG